jgi:hypothetical protein
MRPVMTALRSRYAAWAALGLGAAAVVAGVVWSRPVPPALPHVAPREVASPMQSEPVLVPRPPARRWTADDALAREAGFTPLRPAYLVAGCAPHEQWAEHGEVHLVYAWETTPAAALAGLTKQMPDLALPRGGCLAITQQRAARLVEPRVGRGAVEAVRVGDLPGLYVRGGWVGYAGSDRLYFDDLRPGGTLFVERDGLVVRLTGTPDVGKDELVRIAASLR